jgi:hypothetical protein
LNAPSCVSFNQEFMKAAPIVFQATRHLCRDDFDLGSHAEDTVLRGGAHFVIAHYRPSIITALRSGHQTRVSRYPLAGLDADRRVSLERTSLRLFAIAAGCRMPPWLTVD